LAQVLGLHCTTYSFRIIAVRAALAHINTENDSHGLQALGSCVYIISFSSSRITGGGFGSADGESEPNPQSCDDAANNAEEG
jgi:hypothetical protein